MKIWDTLVYAFNDLWESLLIALCFLTFFGLLWLVKKGLDWLIGTPIAEKYDPNASGKYKVALASHIGTAITLGFILGWTLSEFVFAHKFLILVDTIESQNIRMSNLWIRISPVLTILISYFLSAYLWISNRNLKKFPQSISTLKMNCQVIMLTTIIFAIFFMILKNIAIQ